MAVTDPSNVAGCRIAAITLSRCSDHTHTHTRGRERERERDIVAHLGALDFSTAKET